MGNKIAKFFVGLVLTAAILLLSAFNVLLLWVATGPRPLTALTPMIEQALAPSDARYSVHIGETWLVWDGWKHPVGLRLRVVDVRTRDGRTLSSFPEIGLNVDVPALLSGHILPTSLTVLHPSLRLIENTDHSLNFSINEQSASGNAQDQTVGWQAVTNTLLSEGEENSLRKFRLLTIQGASLSIANGKGTVFEAKDANITITRDRKGAIRANAVTVLHYGAYRSDIHLQLALSREHPEMEGKFEMNDIMPSALAGLITEDKRASALQLPFSITGNVSLAGDGALNRLRFSLNGGPGIIASDQLEGPIAVKALHAEGVLTGNAHDIQLDTLAVDLGGGVTLAAQGALSLHNGEAAAYGHASMKNVPADDVRLFWPPAVSKDSRAWVTGNITGGLITSAEAKVDIHFGDLAKPNLPKEDIDGTLALQGASIRYLPDHPEVRNVKGVIHVDGTSLEADLASADFLKESKLANGKVMIDNLNDDNPYIKVTVDAATSARDAVHFLGLPRLGHAKRLNLEEDRVAGTLKGNAALGFRFFAPRDALGNKLEGQDLDYAITADLNHVSTPQLMHKFDIADAIGTIAVNNQQLSFKGEGEVNGASVSSAQVKYLFKPQNGLDTFIDAEAVAPVEVLPRFGYPQFSFITGTLGAKLHLRQGDTLEKSDASLDLTHAALAVSDIAWSKPDGRPATLDLSAAKENGQVIISAFHVTSEDTDASGNAQLARDLSAFTHIALNKCIYGKTDLDSLVYEPRPGGFQIEAHGKTADITRILGKDPAKDSTFSFEHFPAIRFSGDVGRLIVGEGHEITGFSGSLDCDTHYCTSADLSGKTEGKAFAFRIGHNAQGLRQLAVQADDAGAFLRNLDIFDGMEGGTLRVTGDYDDSAGASLLKGRMEISEHTIKHAPILTRILSLASLTGVFDMLQGNGIRFTALAAPFTLQNDVLTLPEAKTYGPAMGIKASGTITFPGVRFNLHGTLAPSYTFNSLLGKVPLIGKALAGGEGQGLFAARFHVTGSEREPDVSVNPLSMLTPGFTRNFFDIFDAPETQKK